MSRRRRDWCTADDEDESDDDVIVVRSKRKRASGTSTVISRAREVLQAQQAALATKPSGVLKRKTGFIMLAESILRPNLLRSTICFDSFDDYCSLFTELLWADLRGNLVSGQDENSPVDAESTIVDTEHLRVRLSEPVSDIAIKDFVCVQASSVSVMALVLDQRPPLYTLRVLKSADLGGSVTVTRLGTSITFMREYIAVRTCARSKLLPFILKPMSAFDGSVPLDLLESAWDQLPPLVMSRLEQCLNASQLDAVKTCAEFKAPFALLQGPPGTGKTTTVLHLLNVLHLSLYQRHYLSVLAVSMMSLQKKPSQPMPTDSPAAEPPTTKVSIDIVFEQLASVMSSPPNSPSGARATILPRPRILVCAPSNAAVDEIVSRVATDRLIDGNGRPYTPDIVRVGRPSSIRAGVIKDNISLDHLVDAFFRYSKQQLNDRLAVVDQHRKRVAENLRQIHEYALHLQSTGAPCDLSNLAMQITSLAEERYRILLERQRLEIVRDHNRESACTLLQRSFLDEAQIVFSTLSGTASRFLGGGEVPARGFEICIIDESAQCVESSTLIPLVATLSVRSLIMIGDPRQLPATVFVMDERARIYERSLFERLQQAGCPVLTLDIQYRMHPEIRRFPSFYFYEDRLKDAPSTLAYDMQYYGDRRFRPYLFFDVAGQETQRRSVRNASEASFIAQHLGNLVNSFPDVDLSQVAVITPYSAQVDQVRSVLGERFKVVEVSTIDSFQGREKNIIMFSCVRAGRGRIGFVQDIRRMNVGVTRARHAMWIVGHASTLRSSKPWAALIRDARQRGSLVRVEGTRYNCEYPNR
ncbi:unnamed protein product (mitochondrion) [Plasmodiophora brassicae]|uniref:AAA+ ATPase domain-containing protein n=1 Tax=Plasmodiophora brassicae TaxID=37360 RepID=A0A3P3YGE3_PLABS|nr:unnamed protein product [Plasmodiophora brassicae]